MIGTGLAYRKTLFGALLAVVAAGLIGSSHANAQSTDKDNEALRRAFVDQYGEHFDINRISNYIVNLYKAVDYDGLGIEKSEIQLFGRIRLAYARSQVAALILRYDLNGDSTVTREEIETVLATQQGSRSRNASGRLDERTKRRISGQADKLLTGDSNGDGRIEPSEYAEMLKHEHYARYRANHLHAAVAEALLALDPDKDGKVTQVEALQIVGKVFAGVTITPPKRSHVRNNRVPAAHCKAPQVEKGAQIILVGAYEGSSVPSVTVAGQDRETSTTKLIVEPGKDPLFVVLTSYTPMIWRLEGATDRVAHVLVAGRALEGGKTSGGVTGIGADKVSFVPARECLPYFSETGDIKGAQAIAATARLLGAKPAFTFGLYAMHGLHLPTGSHAKPKKQARGQGLTIVEGGKTENAVVGDDGSPAIKVLENAATYDVVKLRQMRNSPGRIVKLKASQVVSDGTAQDYQVLPQEAGLLQLVASGALEHIGTRQFRIVKKMRYPARLTGAHQVKFLLKAGVPEPDGNPGHSCVFSEDKGEFIAGRCR